MDTELVGADEGKPRPLISVVMPIRNEVTTIEAAIRPLLREPVHGAVEIIVADGASTDGTRDAITRLSARDPRVRVIDNPRRTISAGLNAAIQASRGDVIVRIDGHCVPAANYLSSCLAVLAQSGAWNVGGRMVKTGGTLAGRAAAAAASSPFGIGSGRRFHLLQSPTEVDSVWLGCWPRWVFQRVGLYDCELIVAEDEELNHRIHEAGGVIRFDPSIEATYVCRSTWFGLLRQHYRYGHFKVRAIQKRPRVLRLRHLAPAALVAAAIASVLGGLLHPVIRLAGAGTVGLWVGAATWFGARVAPQFGTTAPAVVAAYACLHIGYGVGTWTGLVRFARRWIRDRSGPCPQALRPQEGRSWSGNDTAPFFVGASRLPDHARADRPPGAQSRH